MEQTDAYDAYVDDGDPVDLAMAWEAGEARRRRENALLTKPDHAEAVRDRLTKLTDAERAVLDEISVEDGLHRTLRHVIEDASNGIDATARCDRRRRVSHAIGQHNERHARARVGRG